MTYFTSEQLAFMSFHNESNKLGYHSTMTQLQTISKKIKCPQSAAADIAKFAFLKIL